MKKFTITGLGIVLALFSADGLAQDAVHGAEDYKLCASCHGFKAEGNQLVNAPALAGQADWYLLRQIRNYRAGIRGTVAGDTHGIAMAQMTQGLDSEEKIADIVAYIGTLPAVIPAATVSGDAKKGESLYASCSACHGSDARGNPAMNAPTLVNSDDWYQLRQLQSFRSGLRGAHPDDTFGQQMRPMAGILADEQAMQDVIAYINGLK